MTRDRDRSGEAGETACNSGLDRRQEPGARQRNRPHIGPDGLTNEQRIRFAAGDDRFFDFVKRCRQSELRTLEWIKGTSQ